VKSNYFCLNLALLSLCASFVICDVYADEAWSRFRGENASGASKSAKIPSTWSDTENLAWKTALPGHGSSSPVVRGGRVYLTAYSGYGLDFQKPGDIADLRLHTLCLDFETGKIIWDQTIEASEHEQKADQRIVEHGYASPTPTVDDEAVYAAFGPSGLVAYDLDGKKLWQRSVGTKTKGFGAASSPIIYKDLVIINAAIEDQAAYGLNKKTGEVVWRTEDIREAWTTPSLVVLPDGSTELVINQKNWILGFDPETGKELWRCKGIEDYVVPCVVVEGNMLYCSGGRQNRTIAVRAGGRGDVTATHRVWEIVAGANVTSPLYHDGYLYWSHDKSMALCVKASDGQEVFRQRLPTSARIYASVVLAGDRLLMTTRDSGVVVLAAEPNFRELGVNRLGSESESFNATPAIVGNSVLIRSDQFLYRIAAIP
jgi:outer membrane protein assembly factor BamB